MTGDHGNSFTRHNGKDIPQFVPNFTVYLLPPDVVCLYSEDRKFFLHGELYCALASAIGEGGKSFRELVRELKPDFPSDKIQEALNLETAVGWFGFDENSCIIIGIMPYLSRASVHLCG